MYQDLSKVIARLADIQSGMTVLDLGCGTGVTSQLALENLGAQGHLFALDFSEAMLAVAQAQLPAEKVTLIHADAHIICQSN